MDIHDGAQDRWDLLEGSDDGEEIFLDDFLPPQQVDLDEILQDCLPPVMEETDDSNYKVQLNILKNQFPYLTIKERKEKYITSCGNTKEKDSEEDSDQYSEEPSEIYNQAEMYNFEDYDILPPPRPVAAADKQMTEPGYVTSVNDKVFIRSKTLPNIPVQQILGQDVVSGQGLKTPTKNHRVAAPSKRSTLANRGFKNRPQNVARFNLPGEISDEGTTEPLHYYCSVADRKLRYRRRQSGTAWAPDDDEDGLIYDSHSPTPDKTRPSIGTLQLYYTTPPSSQMASSPSPDGGHRSRLERAGSGKGSFSRLARRLSHKESRRNTDDRKKALRQRSISLDCGDGRRPLMTTPEPQHKDDRSLTIPVSPSLPTKLTISSPNLAGRLSRRASGGSRRKGNQEPQASSDAALKGDRKKKKVPTATLR